MPSPVGHLLAGAGVYLAGRSQQHHSRVLLVATLAGSIVPDFDFLPGILIGNPSAYHHGISHSLMFAIGFGVVFFFFAQRFHPLNTASRAAMIGAFAYAFHILLDGVSVTEGARALPVLWPFSEQPLGVNVQLLGHFYHDGLENGIWSVIRWDNLPALTRELAVLGIPVLLLQIREISRKAAKDAEEGI